MNWKGIYAAMLTPLCPDGKVNTEEVRRLTEFLIEKGVHGLFPVSNVGGQIHLPLEEKCRFIEAVVEEAKGRAPVFLGISASNTKDAIQLGRYCESLGASGAVLSAPFYFPYPQEVVRDGLLTVAESLRLPIILYHIPLYANPIGPDTLRDLFRCQNIMGMKDSSGSIDHFLAVQAMAAEEKREFHLFVGWEEMLFSALELGADGCMTASAGIFPEIMRALFTETQKGNRERALQLQRLIARATGKMKKVFFPYGYQLAMEARGFDLGPYPVSLRRSYEEERQSIRRMVEDTLNLFQSLQTGV